MQKTVTTNEQLDNAKSDFIAIASHQLRTPLTAIKGFVSLLIEGSYGEVEPKQLKVLKNIYASNQKLVGLVDDLLNISRMETGRMEFTPVPCQMETICQGIIDSFTSTAKECGLNLEYKKPKTALPELIIDGDKVREVISNMLDNAIKYTPRGDVKLKIEQIADNIRVTVSDTGIGVLDTEMPYLFTKFSRGKDTKRLNATGIGIGLYVDKFIIEAQGGRIWAESDGGEKGSRFIIELPIKLNI
jgi:signal transduction histidine kinase